MSVTLHKFSPSMQMYMQNVNFLHVENSLFTVAIEVFTQRSLKAGPGMMWFGIHFTWIILIKALPIIVLISIHQSSPLSSSYQLSLPNYHLSVTHTGQHTIQSYLHVTLYGGNQHALRGPLVWDLVKSRTAILDREYSYMSDWWALGTYYTCQKYL